MLSLKCKNEIKVLSGKPTDNGDTVAIPSLLHFHGPGLPSPEFKLYHHNMSEQGDVCKCNGPPPDTACVGAEECQVSTFE